MISLRAQVLQPRPPARFAGHRPSVSVRLAVCPPPAARPPAPVEGPRLGHRPHGSPLSSLVAELIGPVLAAADMERAVRGLHAEMAPLGAVFVQMRDYRRPRGMLSPASHWATGGRLTVSARPGWGGGPAHLHVFAECEPPLELIRQRRTTQRLSHTAPADDAAHGSLWAALAEADAEEMFAAAAYGDDLRICAVHVGFAQKEFAPEVEEAVALACLLSAEHLMRLNPPPPPPDSSLTSRELAVLRLVAAGKSDGEIATIFGGSEHTARFHVDNARRKLDAVSRAQAVAYLAAAGLL